LVVPDHREIELTKLYGDMTVTGHADGISLDPDFVTDYKTTSRFDADRYMESFQWKFYLDMSGMKEMLYQVFVMKPFAREEHHYSVKEFHTMRQYAYPDMHDDCEKLVRDYRETVMRFLEQYA
jgi:hypothetical protein